MSETFELTDGYDRNKVKRKLTVRRLTLEEIKALRNHADIIANDGTLRHVKINGAVKTWKTDPTRIEVPVKYGMREYARFNTAEALQRFVTVVRQQPEYTDCPNCGTTDHTWLPCPCECHEPAL